MDWSRLLERKPYLSDMISIRPIVLCAWVVLLGFEVQAQTVAEQVAAIQGDVYSDEWSEPARAVLLAAYDANVSGELDTVAELNSVSCEAWSALNTAVESDLLVIYGFHDDYHWVGDALGFSIRFRRSAFDLATACIEGWLPPTQVAEIVSEIAELDNPSTVPWKNNVGRILVRNYDADDSGALSTESEVFAVDCAIWEEVEAGYEQGQFNRFWIGYGIKNEDYLTWNAGSLGLDESIRAATWRAIQECIDVDSVQARETNDVATVANQINQLDDGGSFGWKSSVGRILVDNYDSNDSGDINTASEISAISCDVWQAIDDGYRQGDYENFWVGYGLSTATHLTWNAGALKLTESTRADSWAAVQRCIERAR